jgi:hypothetical protein
MEAVAKSKLMITCITVQLPAMNQFLSFTKIFVVQHFPENLSGDFVLLYVEHILQNCTV